MAAGARASLEGARVALGRMMYASAISAPREVPLTMAARAAAAWSAVEQVLRGVTGHAELSGQPLLAETRRQNAISLDEAHVLVAMNDWVERTRAPGSAAQMLTLPPTDLEREVATKALAVLERAVGNGESAASDGAIPAEQSQWSPPVFPVATPVSVLAEPIPQVVKELRENERLDAPQPMDEVSPQPIDRVSPQPIDEVSPPVSSGSKALMVGALVLVIAMGGGSWYFLRGRGGAASNATEQGIAAYTKGSVETAQMEFKKAVDANPKDTRALTYLGRIAREQHDIPNARKYLEQAIEVEPENALGLRELGSVLLIEGQPELARRFYVHALNVNSTDKVAQGFLGCALLRLHRPDEAKRWFERAGAGDWTSCSATPTPN